MNESDPQDEQQSGSSPAPAPAEPETWTPPRGLLTKTIAWVVILLMLGATALMLVSMIVQGLSQP